MFQRALKLRFNEQKFLQTSIVRLQRIESKDVNSTGKRFGVITAFLFLPSFVKWYRKGHTHKVCYTPLRKGLHQLKNDPYHKVLAKGEVYGENYGPKGRPHF